MKSIIWRFDKDLIQLKLYCFVINSMLFDGCLESDSILLFLVCRVKLHFSYIEFQFCNSGDEYSEHIISLHHELSNERMRYLCFLRQVFYDNCFEHVHYAFLFIIRKLPLPVSSNDTKNSRVAHYS
jgi:hypothetical protein